MNPEERYKITSNEYADLLIAYDGNMNVLNSFPNVSINLINRQFATAYIPVSHITSNSIYKFGYLSLPSCYQLVTSTGIISPEMTTNQTVPDVVLSGNGVLVGFVDTGIDYRNPAFINEYNQSRIITIWDQTIDSENYPKDIYYGTVFSNDQINQALNSENPLSIVPSTDDIGHGTMLAGIAGGSPILDRGFIGITPDVDFVIVKLKPAKPVLKDFYFIPQETLCYQENDIMFGIKYLLQVAAELHRPIAICIGLGTSQGAHTGLDILSRYLSSIGETSGTAIVVAAGDEGNRGHHYYNEITPSTSPDMVELNISEYETGFSMELWGNEPTTFSVDIFTPTNELISRVPAIFGQTNTLVLKFQDTTIYVDNQQNKLLTGDQLMLFRFQNPTAGIWRFQIQSDFDLPLNFHMWLPSSAFITTGTFFLEPNPYTIITSPGNASVPITISAYNNADQTLNYYASRGFTVLNRPKPDLVAPGVDIYTLTIDNQFVISTGSSLAAAYTTGVAAMLLNWGILEGNVPSMSSFHIKRILIESARRDPSLTYPNQEWGYGILDMNRIINYITYAIF